MPGLFFVMFLGVIVVNIVIWTSRVSAARNMARRAGLDEDAAAATAAFDRDGIAATYLASSWRNAVNEQRPNAESRLRELAGLLERGLITRAEYDERRKSILDAI